MKIDDGEDQDDCPACEGTGMGRVKACSECGGSGIAAGAPYVPDFDHEKPLSRDEMNLEFGGLN